MFACWRQILHFSFLILTVGSACGSGLNVVVVVNQNSSNSVQLGNYYCEKRQIPPQNVLRVNWTGGNIEWSKEDLHNVILTPLQSMLSARQLTNQIDYVVLSMDLPYRVVTTNPPADRGTNSTTSALFYGFKPDSTGFLPASCNLPAASSNSYAGSEGIFRSTPPGSPSSNSFLVTMLTSSNLAQAKLVVDRAVASDGTFPTQTVFLAHTDDRLRNIRYALFDNAIFNTRLRGNFSMQATNVNDPNSLGQISGYQSGIQWAPVSSGVFAPGAMADNMTSFSGQIFEQPNAPNFHVTALAFLNAGAAGSFGTVVEPCAWLQKFPSPQNYFFQARGFTLAECYYQSVTNPHQGLLLGEPLAAPFAQPANAAWVNLPADALLSGSTNLTLNASAADAQHPIQQVDLFIDGNFAGTLTNIAPRPNNVLNVTLKGHSMNYTVQPSDTIKSVATGLSALMNLNANTNVTQVRAFAHGDRIELQGLDINDRGNQIPISVSNSIGSAAALTTHISTPGSDLMDSPAFGLRSYVITNTPLLGDFLQLVVIKTNGQSVSVAVTNTVPGTTLADFARSLFTNVNSHIDLLSDDGLVIEDVNMHEDPPYNQFVYGLDDHSGEFNIRARSPGWLESQVRVRLLGSPTFGIQPSGTNRLDENVSDLKPRTHVYIMAGVTNLPLTFGFNTVTQADGFHELAAVVYEGSHVRTQKRISTPVKIQNNSWSASFIVGPTNAAVESVLPFSVVANTNNITKIELFSTGGALTNLMGQSSATFAVVATQLGMGLHPFYAILTGAGGKQYRTETKWIRLVGLEESFPVSILAGPKLEWPATPGRRYEILSATNVGDALQVQDSLLATNFWAQWFETNSSPGQRLYRIRTANPLP